MFEDIHGDREWFMQHIDDRIQPRHHAAVVQRVYESIRSDDTVPEPQLMAASLLLGQYVEVTPEKETLGKPVAPVEFPAVGLHLPSEEVGEVVDRINQTVQAVTTTMDLSPSERPDRYVGEKDYNEKDAFSVYLEKLEEYPVLSNERQRELGTIIQDGRKAQAELDLLEDKDIKASIQNKLAQRIAAGKEAHQQMVLTNLRFAVYIAKRYQGRGLPLDDLIEEANIALMDAAEKWQPNISAKFTSYAGIALERRVERALEEQATLIRVPSYLYPVLREYREKTKEHKDRYGTYPTNDQLQDMYGYSSRALEGIQMATRALLDVSELNAQPMWATNEEATDEDRGVGLKTQKGLDPNSYSMESEVERAFLQEAIDTTLKTLNDREAGIIRWRTGLNDGEPKTLDEIGLVYGVTRERIRQVEKATLGKLRNPVRADQLRDYLDDIS